MRNINIEIPCRVKFVLERLGYAGYEAYVVGGCVRDALVGRMANDWDITTSALPDDVISIFEKINFKVIETGIKHGTVTVVIENEYFEVTTYRTDGDYSDFRHPDTVAFTRNLKDDLARRDFTINSMAYNEQNGLIDYFGGELDIKNKIIRCVGNPFKRFNEDALRMLRCIRFSCQLDFDIDKDALLAISKLEVNIKRVSVERIRDELNRILISENPDKGLIFLAHFKLLEKFIPELKNTYDFNQHNKHHDKDIFMHTIMVVKNVPKNLNLRWAALLHDIGKPYCFTLDSDGVGHFYKHELVSFKLAEKILTRLKFDNKTVDIICKLILNHMISTNLNDKSVKKLIVRLGKENIYDLLKLIEADRKALSTKYINFDDVLILKSKVDDLINKKDPMSVKDLSINGDDLIEIGYKEGVNIGIILNDLLEMVLENPDINTREQLLKIVLNRK